MYAYPAHRWPTHVLIYALRVCGGAPHPIPAPLATAGPPLPVGLALNSARKIHGPRATPDGIKAPGPAACPSLSGPPSMGERGRRGRDSPLPPCPLPLCLPLPPPLLEASSDVVVPPHPPHAPAPVRPVPRDLQKHRWRDAGAAGRARRVPRLVAVICAAHLCYPHLRYPCRLASLDATRPLS